MLLYTVCQVTIACCCYVRVLNVCVHCVVLFSLRWCSQRSRMTSVWSWSFCPTRRWRMLPPTLTPLCLFLPSLPLHATITSPSTSGTKSTVCNNSVKYASHLVIFITTTYFPSQPRSASDSSVFFLHLFWERTFDDISTGLGQMSFLSSKQQHQSTEENSYCW